MATERSLGMTAGQRGAWEVPGTSASSRQQTPPGTAPVAATDVIFCEARVAKTGDACLNEAQAGKTLCSGHALAEAKRTSKG